MTTTVRLLDASYGDAILVSHSNEAETFNLLIDGGPAKTFGFGSGGRRPGPLRIALDEIKEKHQTIDLVILTHIDSDHIKGLIKAFQFDGYLSNLAKQVWLNASSNITSFMDAVDIAENAIPYSTDDDANTSVRDGKTFEQILTKLDCWRREIIIAGQIIHVGPFKFTILSPSRKNLEKLLYIWPDENDSADTAGEPNDYHKSFDELLTNDKFIADDSFANGSSIAFILEVENKKVLFLGDAHDATIIETLRNLDYSEQNKLAVDYVKLSHHGSQFNTSKELLSLIDCRKYLISTDGSRHGHPHKKTLARVFNAHPDNTIYLNYEEALSGILLSSEITSYNSRLLSLTSEIHI